MSYPKNVADKYLAALRKRENWLRQRVKAQGKAALSYDAQEAAALGWAIANLQHLETKSAEKT